MAKRRTKKNPSTTTWLLIAGGVGMVAYLYWNMNKQFNSLQKSGALVKLPVFTDDCAANKAELARVVAELKASGYKETCDVNKVEDPPPVCIDIAINLTSIQSKWPKACGPMPQM